MTYLLLNLPRTSDTELTYGSEFVPWMRHPFFAWVGLRPALAQHTRVEHSTLKKFARGRSRIMEIGVAEGVSALALREAMADKGTLYLVDPFHLSRMPVMNFMKRTARRAVENCARGRVVWIERFSQEVAREWTEPLDLILIDGDHSENAVERDWNDWSKFVVPGGVAIFHDARVFEGGWTTPEYGPVRLVNRLFRSGLVKDWALIEEVHSLVVAKRIE